MTKLKTSCALSGEMSMVLAELPSSTRSAWGQVSSTHNVFSKINTENAFCFMISVIAPGVHGDVLFFNVMLFHWSRSLRAQTEMVENGKDDQQRAKKKLRACLMSRGKPRPPSKAPGVHREPGRRDLLQASVSEKATHL